MVIAKKKKKMVIAKVHVRKGQSVSFGRDIKNAEEMTYPTTPEKFSSWKKIIFFRSYLRKLQITQ